MTDSAWTSRRTEARERRRKALMALLLTLGGTATLRALPHSLGPPQPVPACEHPAASPFQFGAPRTLTCDGAGVPPGGRLQLLLGIKLDVNTATQEDFVALPGIGERTAQRILADREARGAFATVDELDRVKGIGPKTVEKLRPYLTVGGRSQAPAR
ncbi:MAG: ComEA family DNA-binding protein [Myxococcota bacterium]